MINSLITKLKNVIFPPSCFGCGKENIILCETCLSKCKKTIDTPALYINSIYSFRDPLIKKIIHAIKYYHRADLIEPITQELIRVLNIKNNTKEINKDYILVPIPMPKLRKYSRGYNQAELIAMEVSKKTGLSFNKNILTRKSSPKRQVKTINRTERLNNQKKSLHVSSDVRNLNIILVDDVSTTGATISESRKILLNSGAKTVNAITIAH